MNKTKKIVCVIMIVVIFAEIVAEGIAVFIVTIPGIKIASCFRSTKNGFDTINQIGYYALQNNSRPDAMALNFDEKAVNEYCHTFIDNFDPYIMFSYIPKSIDGLQVQCRVANENFFNLYHFSTYDGHLLENKDFVGGENNIVPIIVGYNLKEVYCLGEKYTFNHGDDGKSFEGEVVGILQKGTEYSSLQELRESLDNSYIIPLSNYFIDNYFGLSDYDLSVSSAIINTSNTEFNNIIQKYNEIGFWQLSAIPVTTALNDFETTYLTPLTQKIYMSVVVEFFIVALIVAEVIVLRKLNKNSYLKNIGDLNYNKPVQ